MYLRRVLVLLVLCLSLAPACRMGKPPLPDGRVLSGSDWIPGRSKTALVTGGKPVVIENLGDQELRIGSGADAIVLAPGASHVTDGADIEVHNPSGQRMPVRFLAPDDVTPDGSAEPLDVQMLDEGGTRSIRVPHGGGSTRSPAQAGRVIQEPR
ncbi:MAG: hypothetical protein GY711_11950 [bacterium]|nr:hypothetical protein [bacterium]